jgi:hypothetical protein
MNYKDYMVEDFVLDHSFRDWVLHGRMAHAAFWTLWIEKHPEKYDEIREARQIILILHNHFKQEGDNEMDSRWEEVCN